MPVEVLQYEQTIDFGGGAIPVDVTQQDPPGGAYEVEILDSKQVTKDEGGKTSLRVQVAIVEEGAAKGITTLVVLGTDYSKPFNVGHMANLLIGAGIPADKLKGQIKVRPEILKGKHAFIFVRAPMDGEVDENTGKPARVNKNFVTRAQYEQAKKAQQIAGGQQPAAPRSAPAAGQQPAPTPAAASAGGTGDLGDMFPK